ncbi:MAG TPA: hypothetical protein VF188_09030 [Longimicrobiales bacterium]
MAHPRFRLLATSVAVALLPGAPARAQVPLTPRALGMGGAFMTAARGQESLYLNPANLALPDGPRWSVAFPRAAIIGRLSGSSAGDLLDIARYDDLEPARRDAIFGRIPDSGVGLGFAVRLPFLAVQRGPLAVGISYGLVAEHTVGRDIVELILYGYETGRADYEVGNTSGFQATFWDVAAAYAVEAGAVRIGVTGHYIRGGLASASRMLEPEIDFGGSDIEVDYVGVVARGGNGFGVDIGGAYQPDPAWTLGLVVRNAYAWMDWSDDLRVRDLELRKGVIDGKTRLEDLLDRYAESERPLGDDAGPVVAALARSLAADAYFPTEARLGVGWCARPGTDLGLSVRATLTGGRLAGAWARAVGFGVQQRVPLGSVRAGVATDLGDGVLLGGGLSLGPLDMAIARVYDGEVDGATRSGWMGTVGLRLSGR